MINSRDIKELHPTVRTMALDLQMRCRALGVDLLITSTYRDYESQDALYAQGRTAPGHIVTNAKGGFSFHNFRVAFDVVPLRNGKPVWDTTGENGKLWQEIGELGEKCGLEWAGRWTGKLRESAHFQWTNGLTLHDLQAGKVP